MHREYAVDPESLKDYTSLHSFFHSFVGSPARLISDCPRNWHREVLGVINQLKDEGVGPNKRKGLKNELLKLYRTNVCSTRPVDTWSRSSSWLNYAETECDKNPFDSILSSGKPANPTHPVFSFNELIYSHPVCWNEPNQCHIKRLASAIIAQALPLLRISKKISFVDPYFWFTQPTWNNYRPLLEELAKLITTLNYGRGIPKIEIHTSDRQTNAEPYLINQVLPLFPAGTIVQCKLWPFAEMHDRFILTDVGGIFLGRGLGVGEFTLNKEEEVLVGILERDTYRRELAKLQGTPIEKSQAAK